MNFASLMRDGKRRPFMGGAPAGSRLYPICSTRGDIDKDEFAKAVDLT
jgi:hypothetical protein